MIETEHYVKRTFTAMTYEIDFAGVLSNQVYQRWLEDMRMDMLGKYADIRDIFASGSVPVLARTEIDFKKPVRLMEKVIGTMWVHELQGPKWALGCEFRLGDVVCARSMQYGVFVDTRTFRPTDKPDVLPDVIPQTS